MTNLYIAMVINKKYEKTQPLTEISNLEVADEVNALDIFIKNNKN